MRHQSGDGCTLLGYCAGYAVWLLGWLQRIPVGVEVSVLVVDVTDDILAFCREYDPVTDSTATILRYSHEHPSSIARAL